MVSLPEGTEASPDCAGEVPALATPVKPKRSQRKAKNKQGNDATALSAPDQPDVLCQGSKDANGQAQACPVISILQEFLQDSKTFRVPNQHSILQWHFDQYSVSSSQNQFRATVAFLLEGVPHHVAGAWHTSKGAAKRDTAERALGLFVSQWGSQLPQEQQMNQGDLSADSRNLLQNLRSGEGADGQVNVSFDTPEVGTLMNYCLHFPPCQGMMPQLSIFREPDSDTCKGVAQISLFGVQHTFAGIECKDECAAQIDVARRLLWYLQCPGFNETFEVDYESLAAGTGKITSPPSEWSVEDGW